VELGPAGIDEGEAGEAVVLDDLVQRQPKLVDRARRLDARNRFCQDH
ncbi:hypothetical protein chiPu_0031932, partial [Chiloscyllium punctatum]|nr:hypothetical protein [Chiloscyllium punctatum]